MSFAAGFLGGAAEGYAFSKEQEARDRELGVMEALAADRAAGGSSAGSGGTSGGGGAGGGAGSGGSYTYDGKISDRATHAYNRFLDAGMPDYLAAGAVGNLMQESGVDIDPAAVGDNGNAFGAAQHNGPRRHALIDFAASKGVEPTDFDAQIDFLLHEMETTEAGNWKKVMAATSPEEAAIAASKYFWRPGAPHNEQRAAYARSVYDRMQAPPAEAAPAPAPASAVPTSGQGSWQWFDQFAEGAQ